MGDRFVRAFVLAAVAGAFGCSDGAGRTATSSSLPTVVARPALSSSLASLAASAPSPLAPLGPAACAPASEDVVALRSALRGEAACFGPRVEPGQQDPARTGYRKLIDGDAPDVRLDEREDAWVRGVRERCGRLVTIVEVQSVAPEGCLRSAPDDTSRDAFEFGIRMRAIAVEAWARAAGGDFAEAARLAGRALRVAAILGRSDAELDWMLADSTIVDLAKLVDRWSWRLDEAARRDVAEDVTAARGALLGEAERFGAYALGYRAKARAEPMPELERGLMLDAIELLVGEVRSGDSVDGILSRCAEESKEDLPLMEALDRAKVKPSELDPGQRRAFVRHLRGQLVHMFEPLRKRGADAARALDALAARL